MENLTDSCDVNIEIALVSCADGTTEKPLDSDVPVINENVNIGDIVCVDVNQPNDDSQVLEDDLTRLPGDGTDSSSTSVSPAPPIEFADKDELLHLDTSCSATIGLMGHHISVSTDEDSSSHTTDGQGQPDIVRQAVVVLFLSILFIMIKLQFSIKYLIIQILNL